MAFDREDIKLGAKYPFLIYGDGYIGQITSMVPGRDSNGDEIYRITLIPSPELAKRHGILLEYLDRNLTIKVQYPIEMISQLSNDPVFTVYFNFLNFKGGECPGTNIWLGKLNAETIISLKRIINSLRAENAYLREQYNKATTQVQKFIKEDLMGPATEIGMSIAAQNMQMQSTGPVRNQ